MRLTEVQMRTIHAIQHEGAKVYRYMNSNGKLCYRSDHDGLRAVLYLTLTMRSLDKKGFIDRAKSGLCSINKTRFAISCN